MMPLAITGVGSVTPLGNRPDELLAALDARASGLSAIDLDGLPPCRCRWAGQVTRFDSSPYLPAKRARRLDRGSLFALAAAHQALADAGLAGSDRLGEELGVVVGTCSAGSGPLTLFLDALFRQSPEAAPPFEFPNTVANAPASHVSIELRLRGPNVTLSHKESVIGPALVYGGLWLKEGRCSALLLGATDEWNVYYHLGYDQISALRPQPDARSAPGMLLAEGATLMVIEPAEDAVRRGARVLARIAGVGVATTRGSTYRWVADPATLVRAATQALTAGGLSPQDVGSVVLAANGVLAMEEAECAALSELFGARRLPATGVKGAIGERAVAGATSLAVAALARRRGALPPYAGGALTDWGGAVELLAAPAPVPPGATLVLSYGAGGNYAAVVLS